MNFLIVVWIICIVVVPLIVLVNIADGVSDEERKGLIFYASILVIFGPFVVFPAIAIAICYMAWYIGWHVFDAWKFQINEFKKWLEE